MSTVITIEGLSKRYQIGARRPQEGSFRDSLMSALKQPMNLVRGNGQRREDFWALKDVSFNVEQGEVIGIIGRNGAGKSTLLKILSRITDPTAGRIEMSGRVGSLLEVGTGFHPELTGRENIYLNGSILGMSRRDIRRNFDEIVDFAEVDRFIDTPVKYYSSGMYVRLAFAVAAHLEPEILIVDEVLAVGDAAFQKKCLGKMGNIAKRGRTVLFVSHNAAAVEALCHRACRLKDGKLVDFGSARDVVSGYLEEVSLTRSIPLRDRKDRQGEGHVRLVGYSFLDGQGRSTEVIASGQDLSILLSFEATNSGQLGGLVFGIGIFTLQAQNLIQCSNELVGVEFDKLPNSGQVMCRLPRLPLAPGMFSINFIVRRRGVIEDWIQDAGQLAVEAGDFFGTGRLPPATHGGLLINQEWSVV
jgi:lipopolysaccharide transport system ATP-binding protein